MATKTKTQVKKYKGDRALQRGLNQMAKAGWEVQDRTARKKVWNWKTGIFTNQQIHSVTFVKTVERKQKQKAEEVVVQQQPAGWYPDQNNVTRWWDGSQWTDHVHQAS